MRHLYGILVGAVLSAFLPGSAGALVINSLNNPVPFTISQNAGGGLLLSATGTVAITSGFNSDSLVLHVILNNASSQNGTLLTPAANVRLAGWGFGVDP